MNGLLCGMHALRCIGLRVAPFRRTRASHFSYEVQFINTLCVNEAVKQLI